VVEGGCRRRGEMGTEKGEVRRPRGALADRLTCPLCQDLFQEASAFTECLHTCK
jgi:E3 ubiquitin-protein ligase DRIP